VLGPGAPVLPRPKKTTGESAVWFKVVNKDEL
jgi:hypothetical protein